MVWKENGREQHDVERSDNQTRGSESRWGTSWRVMENYSGMGKTCSQFTSDSESPII